MSAEITKVFHVFTYFLMSDTSITKPITDVSISATLILFQGPLQQLFHAYILNWNI